MNAQELASSASSGGNPPAGLSDAASALWLARAGRWSEAHDLCQKVKGSQGAWVNAHLHRVQGDLANAKLWYAKAHKSQPEGQSGLAEEWMLMAEEFIASAK